MPNRSRPRRHRLKVAFAIAFATMAAGTTCPTTPGTPGSGFPKSTAWTQKPINNNAGVTPNALTIADFDGDGTSDVAVAYAGADPTPASYVIFFRAADNTFTTVSLLGTVADVPIGAAIKAADMNNDTRPDLIVATDQGILYILSPADPRVGADWQGFIISGSGMDSGIGPWRDVAIGDIDGAAGPDIVAAGGTVGRLCWFRSPAADTNSGSGWARIDIDTTTRTDARSVALIDLTNDSRLDIVSTAPGETENRVAWYGNPANPSTDAWPKVPIGNLPAAGKLAIGDLNVDGRADVVAVNRPGRQIGWYIRPADPTQAWSGFQVTQYNAATPIDLAVADIDGNSQPDLVVATQQPGSLRWFTPVGVQTNVWTENQLRDLNEDVAAIATGDFDADSRPDVTALLIGATAADDSVAWFENPEP
ncbi:MAG: VCBS repeat-containing protein [Phycisphaerales bacterium]|nr:VCBS repeat-containing protein [Phycisphaerales bacterium]MCB9856439.1 VCBS repeat-containing protein [Phycisphaerales bacterium]